MFSYRSIARELIRILIVGEIYYQIYREYAILENKASYLHINHLVEWNLNAIINFYNYNKIQRKIVNVIQSHIKQVKKQ